MDDEARDDEEEAVEKSARKKGPPRFGSFVTIAASILLLFGAASRVGRMEETFALFGLDRLADSRIKQEEERLRTAITIGARPVQPEALRPPAGSLPVRHDVQPPYRGEIEPDEVRSNAGRSQLSLGVPADAWGDENQSESGRFEANAPDRAIGGPPPASAQRQPDHYVVANGDTWNKIALKTLGDGKRWQEIRRANPAAENGLTVGMRLVIPQ